MPLHQINASLRPDSGIGLYAPAGWGKSWRAAKAAAASQQAVVAVVGHSVTRGYCADLDTDGWVARLRAALQTKHGDGGSGFRGVVDSQLLVGSSMQNWANQGVISAGWSEFSGGGGFAADGPGGTLVVCDSTAGRTWKFPGMRGTHLRAFLVQAAGNGSATLTVDNEAPSAPIITGGASAIIAPSVVAAPGTHDLTVTSVAQGAGLGMWGAEAANDTGVVVHNYGKSGGQTADFGGTGTFGRAADWMGGLVNPADLLIWSLDLGDILHNVAPDTYLANVRAFFDSVRGQGPKHGATDILIVANHPGTIDDTARLQATYAIRLRELAEVYGAAMVNVWAEANNSYDHWADLGYWGVDGGTTGAAGDSAVHPSAAGQKAIFDSVSRVPGLL